MIKVLFAPDWRKGVPYQQLLAGALEAHGVQPIFPEGYRRGFPLSREVRHYRPELVHLHWPEPYWFPHGDWMDFFRRWRYLPDVALTRLQHPLVYTAHNLWPHNQPHSFQTRCVLTATLRASDAVIAHSQGAMDELVREFPFAEKKGVVIPHGDLSVAFPPPLAQSEAREILQLDTRPLVLMFGHVEPYKGIEEVISWWKEHRPAARLAVVGRPLNAEYQGQLESLAAGASAG
jgi:glycosyltransferase involved in cell wall biosynthesis